MLLGTACGDQEAHISSYAKFWSLVVLKYVVTMEGWPLPILTSPSKLTTPQLKLLDCALTSGSLKFIKLQADELDLMIAEKERMEQAGEKPLLIHQDDLYVDLDLDLPSTHKASSKKRPRVDSTTSTTLATDIENQPIASSSMSQDKASFGPLPTMQPEQASSTQHILSSSFRSNTASHSEPGQDFAGMGDLSLTIDPALFSTQPDRDVVPTMSPLAPTAPFGDLSASMPEGIEDFFRLYEAALD
jgi:hypothetical protein